MDYFAPPLAKLIEQFESLPSIGHKTAQRLAFYVLSQPMKKAKEFADALIDAKESIGYCSECQNLTSSERCAICASSTRDRSVICVVEDPRDVVAVEKTGEFEGLYHVLHGAISPMNGIGPDELKIKELLSRISEDTVKEVILATNPDVEGDATAMYISRLIKPLGLKVTRLAYGIPVGGELEYADENTLRRALEGRSEF